MAARGAPFTLEVERHTELAGVLVEGAADGAGAVDFDKGFARDAWPTDDPLCDEPTVIVLDPINPIGGRDVECAGVGRSHRCPVLSCFNGLRSGCDDE